MFEKLLERIAQGLTNGGIPYMVIGGQAVLLYGEPRLTKDIDVTLGADLTRLQDVLSVGGPRQVCKTTFALTFLP